MFRQIILVTTVVGCVLAPTAHACEDFVDANGIFSFGRYELGAHPSTFDSDVRESPNCYKEPAYDYFDCGYVDKDGVEYIAFESEIVTKEIPDLAKYSGRLIGGIQAGDTIGTVLRKLGKLREELHFWTGFASQAKDSKALVLSPDRCLRLANGTMFWFHLEFDENDKLVAMSAWVESSI